MLFHSSFQHLILLFFWLLITGSHASAPVIATKPGVQAASSDPQLLTEATRLAWLDNWRAAAPVFKHAESLLRARGDKHSAIYAHVGVLRSDWVGTKIRETVMF